uniref:Ig-like domain-containing protein n=1 Tax=Urocitellus parryii TaxID=9999 RepID=A0A8D2GJ74_UROPR
DAWTSTHFGSVFYNDVLHFPGVVTQETSLTTTPGGTVTLTCGSSTGAITISNYAGWVQQKPYQVSQGLIGSTSNRFPGVPASYSGSLLSRGAQTEDEATYYCVTLHVLLTTFFKKYKMI